MRSPLGARTNTRAHALAARPNSLVVIALVAAVGYLMWRTGTLGTGPQLALSIPLFTLEVWAFCSLAALAHSAHRRPGPLARRRSDAPHPPLDVVIGAAGAAPVDVEISLIACDALPGDRAVVVLDTVRRAEIADLARDHDVFHELAMSDPADDPLVLFSDLVSSEQVLWIRAGQTPMPDVDRAALHLDDPRVGVVQIGVGARNDDSMVHIDRGRDEHALVRSVLGPALSTRGLAPWDGPGSVVRRAPLVAALRQAPPARDSARAVEQLLVRLHAAGYESRFEPRPLVRVAAPDTLDDYLAERRERMARSLAILGGVDSPVTGRSIALPVRLRHLATLAPWFEGTRLVMFTAVLTGVIVSGTMPFSAPVHVMAPAAGTIVVLGALARRRIAGETMATGDWIRGAWRAAGADLAGFFDVATSRRRRVADRCDDVRWQRLGRLRLLSAAIVMVELAIVARAATLVWEGLLPAFTTAERMVVVAIGLATLVPMLDVMQLVVGRRQRRQTYRIKTSIPIVVAGARATTIDLAANGVAFALDTSPDSGAPLPVELRLPRIDGTSAAVQATATVRSTVPLGDGRVRVGAALGDLTAADRAVLISYCTIEQPFLAQRADEATSVVPEQCPGDFEIAAPPLRRRALRALTATAAILGVTTAAAGPAFAAVPTSICVTSATGGVEGLAVQAYLEASEAADPGWTSVGTTGVDGCLALAPDGAVDTTMVEVTHDGQRLIATVDDNGAVGVELVRLVQDAAGPNVSEIDTGTGWEPFVSGTEVLPGRLAARTTDGDGDVVKIEVTGGTEVALPSADVSALGMAQANGDESDEPEDADEPAPPTDNAEPEGEPAPPPPPEELPMSTTPSGDAGPTPTPGSAGAASDGEESAP